LGAESVLHKKARFFVFIAHFPHAQKSRQIKLGTNNTGFRVLEQAVDRFFKGKCVFSQGSGQEAGISNSRGKQRKEVD